MQTSDQSRETRWRGALLAALILLVLMLYTWLVHVRAQPEIRYLVPARVELIAPERVPKRGEAAERFAEMINGTGYHAAFAIGPEGRFGWTDNFATQALADKVALAWCEETGVICEIVARIHPEQVRDKEGIPLSFLVAAELEKMAAQPGAKAMVLTDHGAWGAAWGRSTPSEARRAAMEFCLEVRRKGLPDGFADRTCRLIKLP